MGSQFVDLDADGHLDYLAATFDGSPHVARGSREGFAKPEQLLDAKGRRIIISSYWDHEAKAHKTDGRALDASPPPDERCVSAWAHDMDGDGDLDLLLGSYENGRLYVQANEGARNKAAFTGKNVPVTAGGVPFALAEKMTAPRMVDWDRDGDLDLVAGSFGESYGPGGEGGRVVLARNVGRDGKTEFAALETLIPPSPKGGSEPTRPDAGLYADPVDWDGDGDLDLLVGGYSMWTPPARSLSAEEKAQAEELTKAREEVQKELNSASMEYSKAVSAASNGKPSNDPDVMNAVKEASKRYSAAIAAPRAKLVEISKKLDLLVPEPKREAFVWLYERK